MYRHLVLCKTSKRGGVKSGYMLCMDAVVAEWLRRLTRNQFRSAGVGSNPTDRESFEDFQSSTTDGSRWWETPRQQCKHRWFSGRMLACHAGGPGSIPGRCKYFWTFFGRLAGQVCNAGGNANWAIFKTFPLAPRLSSFLGASERQRTHFLPRTFP